MTSTAFRRHRRLIQLHGLRAQKSCIPQTCFLFDRSAPPRTSKSSWLLRGRSSLNWLRPDALITTTSAGDYYCTPWLVRLIHRPCHRPIPIGGVMKRQPSPVWCWRRERRRVIAARLSSTGKPAMGTASAYANEKVPRRIVQKSKIFTASGQFGGPIANQFEERCRESGKPGGDRVTCAIARSAHRPALPSLRR